MNLQSELPAISKALAIKVAAGALLTGLGIHCAYRKTKDLQGQWELTKNGNIHEQQRQAQFTEFRQQFPMSDELQKIFSLSLQDLKDRLAKGQLSAEDVLKAYIAKALEVQNEFNCIAEFIPTAMEKAQSLDNMHMVKGPLHGIPFCVNCEKDESEILTKTVDLSLDEITIGDTPSAHIVQCLESLGAVLFCRTTVPQGHQSFGKALNPLNKKLSPGGPCSGRGLACLVAAGGAPFGIGSDSIGCLRIPAHFCGTSTLKPTENRLSSRGLLRLLNNFPPVPGIMTKRARDVAIVLQGLTDNNLQNYIDGKTVPLPWNIQVFESKQKLRIGYLTSLPIFPSLGDTESVILRVKTYLQSVGHLLVSFDMGEVISDRLLASVHRLGYPLGPELIRDRGKEWMSTTLMTKDDMADAVFDRMKKLDLDLILCPVFPTAAFRVDGDDQADLFNLSSFYTSIWSIVNFPAGVVKVWIESGKNFTYSGNSTHLGTNFKKVVEKGVKESKGMPVGVQIVGKPFHEELVLKTMVELDEINDP